jgi:hypothetical protein
MKAKREQVDDELMVIKLFSGNYARDLFYSRICLLFISIDIQQSHIISEESTSLISVLSR